MKGRMAALNLPGIGSQSIRSAERKAGCFADVYDTWQNQIRGVWRDRFSDLKIMYAWEAAGRQIETIEGLGGQILVQEDPLFPAPFHELENSPILISVLGDPALLGHMGIAVVGTRRPGKSSRKASYRIGIACAKSSRTVVSGLAMGSDTQAHWGAIHGGGKTIAVLPSPLTEIVPKRNRKLAEEIVSKGGVLISEVLPETRVEPYHFVQRNRLIAALSEWIVVVEAGKKSGTMHTVRMGKALNRHIGVVAYENGILSGGCQWILEQSWGVAFHRIEEIL